MNTMFRKEFSGFAVLFARLALSIGFILPVLDRLGYLGPPGSADAAWGDWPHFVSYTNSLMPFLSREMAHVAGVTATLAECVLGLGLLAGFKVKWMGLGTAAITLTFAVFMIATQGIMAPFKYPVFVFTGAGLLLYHGHRSPWSIDSCLEKNQPKK